MRVLSLARTAQSDWAAALRQPSASQQPAAILALAGLLIATLLIVAETILFSQRPPLARLAPDGREAALLEGFHGLERDSRLPFRWTGGPSRINLYQIGNGPQLLDLLFGSPPSATVDSFTLDFAGRPYATLPLNPRPRRYRVLVPPGAFRFGHLSVGLQSATVTVPPDTRQVGLRLEGAILTALAKRPVWPAPALVAAQLLLLALAGLLLRRLHVPARALILSLLLIALALALLSSRQLLIELPYIARLAGGAAILVLLTLWLLPLAERYLAWIGPPPLVRILWGITMLACAIRWLGAFYPLFNAFDLTLNVGRLIKALTGTLVVTNKSFEFRGGVTVYPPGPYLAFLPGLLLGLKPTMLVQGGIGLLDGLSTLTTAALARRLGASRRATIFCALLFAAIPINLTALWWGLSAQAFGQALMMPLALMLLAAIEHPSWQRWLLAGTLLSMALLSHIGVAILAVAWLGLCWAWFVARRVVRPEVRWRFAVMLAVCGLLAVLLIYSDVAALKLQQTRAVGEKVLSGDYTPAYGLILRGFQIAFHELGFVLLLPALLLLPWQRLPPGGRGLLGSWLVVVALFWAVEMYSGLQVRYIYFLTPLACLLLGLILDRIAARGIVPRRLAWTIALLLLAQGMVYWLFSAFAGVRMSMVSLLR